MSRAASANESSTILTADLADVDYASLTDDYEELAPLVAEAASTPELRRFADELSQAFTFATRLHQLRMSLGLKQTEVADLVGEHQSEISRMETAKTIPGFERGTAILSALEAVATARAAEPQERTPARRPYAASRIYRAREVAACILSVRDPEDLITNLKIQKLLYFVQGMSLRLRGAPMFRDQILAWEHGPVVPSVWQEFRALGRNPIPDDSVGDCSRMLPQDEAIVRATYLRWGKYEAWQLRNLTHAEGPWKDTPQSARISEDAIRAHFEEAEAARSAARA
ncbi:MAG: type II toxin-antitoxin system antitoxin SocA domain-containing protein [Myxococcaceae bacterium]